MLQNKYVTSQGETWDMISFKLYDDEHYIDLLIKTNMKYREIVIFPANIELNIPSIAIKPIETLPPWKRGGSNG